MQVDAEQVCTLFYRPRAAPHIHVGTVPAAGAGASCIGQVLGPLGTLLEARGEVGSPRVPVDVVRYLGDPPQT